MDRHKTLSLSLRGSPVAASVSYSFCLYLFYPADIDVDSMAASRPQSTEGLKSEVEIWFKPVEVSLCFGRRGSGLD